MEPNIVQQYWKHLEPDSPTEAQLEPHRVEELYVNGWADVKRVTRESWNRIFLEFPQEEGKIKLQKSDLSKIQPYLYSGPLQAPFDPFRLKEGMREIKWLDELFHKVLRYETDLTLVEWKEIITSELSPKSQQEGFFELDKFAKEFLATLLEERASPLRRLEFILYGEKKPKEEADEAEAEKAIPSVPPPPDEFAATPEEPTKMRKIEKRFYQDERTPQVSDTESLDILEEISSLPEDSDSENPLD